MPVELTALEIVELTVALTVEVPPELTVLLTADMLVDVAVEVETMTPVDELVIEPALLVTPFEDATISPPFPPAPGPEVLTMGAPPKPPVLP